MLPSKLKNLNLFSDADSYLGRVGEVTLPKLAMKAEAWRGGGMIGEIDVDLGLEKLECEWKLGGLDRRVLRQFGTVDVAGVLLRFKGAYQAEDGSGVQAVDIVMRGRHMEIDMGGAKAGDDTEWSIKSTITYYRLAIDGFTEVRVDLLNSIYEVGGIDRYAEIRAALGL